MNNLINDMSMLNYKAYMGQVEFDDEVDIFHGDVINTRAVITLNSFK